jgi:CheY-like chemotaxis protein
MTEAEIYVVLKDIVGKLSSQDATLQPLPENLEPATNLVDLGLDLTSLPEIRRELQARLQGKELDWDFLYDSETLSGQTLGTLVSRIKDSLANPNPNPFLVYVDDEEENLFVFRRKFDKLFRLKTFSDPLKALEFIRATDEVGLVVTDEVMPNLGGNALCDEVHRTKPYMKFVLITGNPNQDEDLMYKSLRQNRFFEFIQKPLDMQNKGSDYETMFRKLLATQ